MTGPKIAELRHSHAEAWQWDGGPEAAALIVDWIESNGGFASVHPYQPLIVLGEEIAPVKPGEWIVRDKFNEFWPLDDGVFHATYRTSL